MDIDKITNKAVPQLQQLAGKFDVDITKFISDIENSIEKYEFHARRVAPFVRAKNKVAALITGKPVAQVAFRVRRPFAPKGQDTKYTKSLAALNQLIEEAFRYSNYLDNLREHITKIILFLKSNKSLLKYQQPRDLLYHLTEYLIAKAVEYFKSYQNLADEMVNLFLSLVKESTLISDAKVIEHALKYIEALSENIEDLFNHHYTTLVPKDMDRLRNFIVTMELRSNSQTLAYVIKCLGCVVRDAIKNIESYLSLSDEVLYIFTENAGFYNLKNSSEIQTMVSLINLAFDNKIGYYQRQGWQSLIQEVHQHKEKFNAMYRKSV